MRPTTPALGGFAPAPEGASPYPVRTGNKVDFWIDGVPFYERLAAAFRAAKTRIWAIVSFIEPAFCFPDGTSWWDLLDECQARGVDVRVLFWRNPGFFKTEHVFLGSPADRAFLAARGSTWAARWDSSKDDRAHCHHQKAYVIDGGEDSAIAFVGGMVLSHATLAHPGHHRGVQKHDAFSELAGPVVADAEHNFVQRWNLAATDAEAPPWPDDARAGPLAMPERVPAPRGEVTAQLARTIKPGLYPGTTQAAGAPPFVSGAGEATILGHYRAAFAAAKRTIYIENQHPGEASLLALLDGALARGVQVVMVVPGVPMHAIMVASREVTALERTGEAERHRYGETFRRLAALGQREGFTLVALGRTDAADPGADRGKSPARSRWPSSPLSAPPKLAVRPSTAASRRGQEGQRLRRERPREFHHGLLASKDSAGASPELRRREIYTHAKLCIVDGEWLTLGSANLVDLSLTKDHSELNVAVWGRESCLPLLRRLVAEHTESDAGGLDDLALLRRIATSARESRASLRRGGPILAGCHAIDPAGYGSNGETGPKAAP